MREIETIWILVATTDQTVLKNKRLLSLETNPNFQLVISNQKIDNQEPLELDKPFTTVKNYDTRGLSKNRNHLLDFITDGIAILADDDVRYRKDLEAFLRNHFKENKDFDLLKFQISGPNERAYKNYPLKPQKLLSNSFINRYRVLSTSSVELAFRVKSIKDNGLQFNTDFGIGSEKYTSGEEAIFLLDALKRGLKIKYVPEIMTYHDGEGTGRKWDKSQLIALGKLYKIAFGFLAIFIAVYITFKKYNTLRKNNIDFFQSIKLLIIGN